ncbi:Guanine nucleotide-binding protein-like 3 [Homalodisca vitripennis]|nr:Guanine nucleotide-binding protein-like 3 [Homalodisca vitripennis]
MSLLGNYCRNNGIKTAIRVGVVGLPNVGKSSIINSLKRNRACSVGATPGVTKAMQEVQLDSKIKLLDSPGVVFASSKSMNEGSFALKNAVKVESVDPIPAATAILQRCTKRQMMDLYCLPEYETPEEFFALKAQRQGKLKSGGVVDMDRAARGLIDDWNSSARLQPEMTKEVSSANKNNFEPFTLRWMSFMNSKNNKGPSMEPWGTPVRTSRSSENCFLKHPASSIKGISTICLRFRR